MKEKRRIIYDHGLDDKTLLQLEQESDLNFLRMMDTTKLTNKERTKLQRRGIVLKNYRSAMKFTEYGEELLKELGIE